MDITSPEGRVALCFHQKYPKLFLKIPEIPRKIPAEILVTKSLKNPPNGQKYPKKSLKNHRQQKFPENKKSLKNTKNPRILFKNILPKNLYFN